MNLNEALASGLKKVTAEFTRAKMQAYRQREDRVSQWQIDRWEKQDEDRQLKAAAYKVIPQAYAAASDNGKLPAKVRQVYYQIRPLVMELTGGKTWKNSDTFTQGVFLRLSAGSPQGDCRLGRCVRRARTLDRAAREEADRDRYAGSPALRGFVGGNL
jgi:hypothetical protein